METLKKVTYKIIYNGNSYDMLVWEGTPLSFVWNTQKDWYTPGSVVMIIDNHGNQQKFMRGMI